MSRDDAASRRDVLKTTGLAGVGALGMLAGCTGGGDGGDGGSGDDGDGTPTGTDEDVEAVSIGGTEEPEDGTEATETAESTEGGGEETARIDFLSGLAAESGATREHVEDGIEDFQSRQGNVEVNLQVVSYGDRNNKISSTVAAGNAPDLAESGATGIGFFRDGRVVDHGSYIEEAEDLPDNWTGATRETAQFRGQWWSAGQNRQGTTMMCVRPELFKSAGVSDPSELETWTGFRRAVEKVDQEFPDVHAFEATGAPNDLESYWGEARTAYTEGADPWIRGDPENPEVLVGEADRTDGMIKNTIDLAKSYSSSSAPSRNDEEIPPLMLTDKVASMTSCLATIQRWRTVKEGVEFGWDGDVWTGPHPRLDPNYGEEFGIEELAGHEGQHGGHAWALLTQKQIFANSEYPDVAWDLAYYTNANESFILPLVGEIYTSLPSYAPYHQKLLEQYDPVQMHQAQIEAAGEYGPQYSVTGAAWDLDGTNQLRWTDLNETISQAMAGQHTVEETPGVIRERMLETLEA
jgi:ABC-type glycerol-3-phosphate transport system substrate-binding protein